MERPGADASAWLTRRRRDCRPAAVAAGEGGPRPRWSSPDATDHEIQIRKPPPRLAGS